MADESKCCDGHYTHIEIDEEDLKIMEQMTPREKINYIDSMIKNGKYKNNY